MFAQVRVCGFEMLIESVEVVVEEMDVAARCDGGTLERGDAVAFEGSMGKAPVEGGDRWGDVSEIFFFLFFSFFLFGGNKRKREKMVGSNPFRAT